MGAWCLAAVVTFLDVADWLTGNIQLLYKISISNYLPGFGNWSHLNYVGFWIFSWTIFTNVDGLSMVVYFSLIFISQCLNVGLD